MTDFDPNSAKSPPPRVLVIDDNADFADLLSAILETREILTDKAATGHEGLELAQSRPYDLIVLDMGLPDISGFEICQTLQANRDLRDIPIMIITGNNSIEDKVRGFELGAMDFISKPFNMAEVEARILAAIRKKQSHETQLVLNRQERARTHAELLRISKAVDSASDAICIFDSQSKPNYVNDAYVELFGLALEDLAGADQHLATFNDAGEWQLIWNTCRAEGSWNGELEMRPSAGESATILCRANRIEGETGEFLGVVCIYTDITHRKRLEKDLLYLAYHDPLTGLHNRRSFRELLLGAIDKARSGASSFLLYLDLDNFKVVNDSAGHQTGDRVLREVAGILSSRLRPIDPVGRFGGDEFTVLLRDLDAGQTTRVARRLLQVFDECRFTEQGHTFSTSVSIGITPIKADLTPEDLLAQADAACNVVKAKGRNDFEIYEADSTRIHELGLEAGWSIRIKDALKEERMEIWLQPVVPLQSTGEAYFEVLLRMRDAQGNIILPGEFLPAAERFGKMMHLDYFVMGRAMALMGENPTLSLSINLSAKTVTDPSLPDAIQRLLSEHRVAPGRVSFEITETAMIQNLDYAKELILHIKQLGCRFALDDFGSGASSMLYLRDLPIDCLKIDGSFVRSLDKDPINRALVKSMNEVAHVLGKQTVAEYVVNKDVLEIVRELGVDFAQGWHICEPSPPRRFLEGHFRFSVEQLARR